MQRNVFIPTPDIANSPVEGPHHPRLPPASLGVFGSSMLKELTTPTYLEPKVPLEDPAQAQRRLIPAYGVVNQESEIGPLLIPRRALRADDVEIELHYCGICHSDIHHVYNEWKDSMYPMVPGHEMTGMVRAIGRAVKNVQVGQAVAVGNLVNSCRSCESCLGGEEQYCLAGGPSWVYNGHDRYPGEIYPSGELTYGGYSSLIVVQQDFVLPLPKGLSLPGATPLLCAGITVFTPLEQNNIGPDHVVGVAGIGGLGHLAIKMAKARGAQVVALTHTPSKLEDALRLGADSAILSSDDAQMRTAQGTMDLIIDTLPHPHAFDPYLNLLRKGGVHWLLGNLEPVPSFNGKLLTNMNRSIGASNVGGIAGTKAMLQFCADNGIEAEYELITTSDIRDAFDNVRASNVRYRYVIDLRASF